MFVNNLWYFYQKKYYAVMKSYRFVCTEMKRFVLKLF